MNERLSRGKMRKPTKRVSATKNIVVEFCPEENCSELGKSHYREQLSAIRGAPRNNVPIKKSPTLPTLKNVASSAIYETRKLGHLEIPAMSEGLPGIKKKESSKVEDRELDRKKSQWQLLKEDKNGRGQKSKMTNSQMKKLQETLQRLSNNEEAQRAWDEKSKRENCSSGVSLESVKNPRTVRFEDEIARVREEIFPRRKVDKSGGDASLEALQKRLWREKNTGITTKMSTLERLKKSWLDEKSGKMADRGGNDFDRDRMRNSRNATKRMNEEKPLSNEEIENFINNYDAREKNPRNGEPELRAPSSDQVAQMLAHLKIDDPLEYEEEDNSNFLTPVRDNLEKSSGVKKTFESRDFGTEMGDKYSECFHSEKYHQEKGKLINIGVKQPTRVKEENSVFDEGRKYQNESSDFWPDSESLLKICLNESKTQIPNCFVSGILKSDYLRSGPDLNPI
ncbi:uncharacterized protein [Venturia canescens]|uniref:uncharacterized protein n=1 Tax=Venturia canescens TaxID=32260 RepID=UPI001C9D43E0|nr:uncharacterized protein LOC122412387 [Venturia canescens]